MSSSDIRIVVSLLLVLSFVALFKTGETTSDDNFDRVLIWRIGEFDDEATGFDSTPHDDPEVVEFNIGDATSTFPSGLGTDIGSQRSSIRINFSEDLSDGNFFLTIRWSPGNTDTEQFSVSMDGEVIGVSQILEGESPSAFTTEEFSIPNSAESSFSITLTHLQGDGTWLDAVKLERLQASSNDNWNRYD